MTAPEAAEFSRPIPPESLGEKGKVLSIEANADERSRGSPGGWGLMAWRRLARKSA